MNTEKKIIIHLICAARPNFMKIAPLYHALKNEAWAMPIIVHTGQHYDLNMSDVFFKDLGIPDPDIHLCVGSGTHAEQTGKVMIAYEKILKETQPDLIVVVGDVNSTVACTLAASKIVNDYSLAQTVAKNKLNVNRPLVAHLEAGLRSFDRTMPEEINRIVTDSLADILWTPSSDGDDNLLQEGIASEKIHRVGNIMIDSLEMLRGKIESENVYGDLNLSPRRYGVVTFHRPSNVDNPKILEDLCEILARLSKVIPLVFPMHPRTEKNIKEIGLKNKLRTIKNLHLVKPMSYRKFMNLVLNCRLAITDSGGIQEETSYLGIPCLTLRPNTERPVTITKGTNVLCTLANTEEKVKIVLSASQINKKNIEHWDGQTAKRIIDSVKEYFEIKRS